MLRAATDPRANALESFIEWQKYSALDNIDGADMRLIPLVYKNLGSAIRDRDVAGRLKGISRYTWIRNSYRIDLCSRLLAQLNAKEVPAVLIKGAALMIGVTGDLSTRQMGDCDLLIARKNKQVAFEALSREGMRSVPADWTLMSEPEIEAFHGLTFELPGKLHDVVDLHWRPLREVRMDNLTDTIFAHARPAVVGGQQALIPCAEHMLLQCLVHGTEKSSDECYDWLADAALILRATPHFDWDLFTLTATQFRLEELVAMALDLFEQEVEIRIPAAAKRALQSKRIDSFDRHEASIRGKCSDDISLRGQITRLLQAVRRARYEDIDLTISQALSKMWRLATTGVTTENEIHTGGEKETAWFPSGWHDREDTGRWSASRFATACLYSGARKQFGKILQIVTQLPEGAGTQFVAVFSGRLLLSFTCLNSSYLSNIIETRLPKSVRKGALLPLQFYVFRAWQPSRLKNSHDTRRLGLFIVDIRTERASG